MSDSPAGWTPEPNKCPKLSTWLGPGFPKNVAMRSEGDLSDTEILLFGIPKKKEGKATPMRFPWLPLCSCSFRSAGKGPGLAAFGVMPSLRLGVDIIFP